MTVVTINHCREAGWCVAGIRRYCADNGLDFRRLVREGLPVEEVEGRECALIGRAIEIAKKERANG